LVYTKWNKMEKKR